MLIYVQMTRYISFMQNKTTCMNQHVNLWSLKSKEMNVEFVLACICLQFFQGTASGNCSTSSSSVCPIYLQYKVHTGISERYTRALHYKVGQSIIITAKVDLDE